MPIKGLTDRRRLPRVGRIKLGVMKQNAQGKQYPSSVPWFEVHEDSVTSADTVTAFQEVYGEQPTDIDIVFPSDDDGLFADAWLKMHNASLSLVCKGDGETARARWDKSKNGPRPEGVERGTWAAGDSQSWEWAEIPCHNRDCPMTKANKCTPVMDLQVILPKVRGFGVWHLSIGSIESIRNIRDNIELLKAATGGRLRGIPLKLRRVPREVTPQGEKKKTVHIVELANPWSFEGLSEQIAKALPGPALMLPHPDDAPPDDAGIEAEQEPIATSEAQPATADESIPYPDDPNSDADDEPSAAMVDDDANTIEGTATVVEPDDIPFDDDPNGVEAAKAKAAASGFVKATDAQLGYLYGNSKIPTTQSLHFRWVELVGDQPGIQMLMDAGDIDPAITALLFMDERGSIYLWKKNPSYDEATAAISALKTAIARMAPPKQSRGKQSAEAAAAQQEMPVS